MNKAREFDQSVVSELKALLGERVSTSAAVREHHGKDESYFPYALPDAVVFAETTEEVRDVVDICRRHRVPMIPFGVGTSLEGHILAVNGGVTIDLSRMNAVLAVHEADLDAVVQAGVTRKQLNEYIKHTGLFFPIDPGADATLGGMTAVTLRLYPVQDSMSAAVCAFPTIDGATKTVIQTLQMGVPVARSELLCATTMAALNRHNKLSYRESPTLFLEFHGTQASVVEQAE